MSISPKILLEQLVRNLQVTENEASQYEVASLQKTFQLLTIYITTQIFKELKLSKLKQR